MPIRLPSAYSNKPQTFLKHRAQDKYLDRWAMKLATLGARLWYVDVFSGPWNSDHEEHEDTSVFLGLTALVKARAALAQGGKNIPIAAIFVEKDPTAFEGLKRLCARFPQVETYAFLGPFQDHAARIDRMVGPDPAFILVDPTGEGFKDARLEHLAVLAHGRVRDVMIRVPGHLNRFRMELLRFLGLHPSEPLPTDDEGVVRLYRHHLKNRCRFDFTASMTVPYGKSDQLACWLVIGGHNPEVLNVFRDVERSVVGADARDLREELRAGDQLTLFAPEEIMPFHHQYAEARSQSLDAIPRELEERLRRRGEVRFGRLWPEVLELHHVTRASLATAIRSMVKKGRVHVVGLNPGQWPGSKDYHLIRLGPDPQGGTR